MQPASGQKRASAFRNKLCQILLGPGHQRKDDRRLHARHELHNSACRESVLIRSAAEAKLREADRLECEAWNPIMWARGPAIC
jgi:hypothetical protein